ncbi:MAG TPA: aminotransferase class III-fold pyridoxal phosphate-dependent enzyme [Anseongella sp.]|nr:aminotransferase class III-fold pyridoxal phosphate-dependent enzyme [Anseongella sp.]
MPLFDVYPLFDIEPVKARGSYLWDSKGRQYLDLYGGHAVISIGHSHPHYIQKISEQLGRIGFYSNSVQIPGQLEVASKLGALSGYADYNLFMVNSGAEANENAFKLASFHTGRKKIITFSKAFHGRTSAAVAATDNPSIIAPLNETDRFVFVPFNDEAALEQVMDEQVAAVVVEGIQGVGGVQVPGDSFLRKIRLLCDKYGAVMILDEVQSGYGRAGDFFAHQHAGMRPDIISMAKGMGNGFPVGGILIHPSIPARHGMLGTTFGGNHLACAAAAAVLDVIREEQLIENASRMGDCFRERLENIDGVREVRGRGLMIGVELEGPCAPVRKALLENHGIFTGSSSDKNTLRILPALNLGEKEANVFFEAFDKVMKK